MHQNNDPWCFGCPCTGVGQQDPITVDKKNPITVEQIYQLFGNFDSVINELLITIGFVFSVDGSVPFVFMSGNSGKDNQVPIILIPDSTLWTMEHQQSTMILYKKDMIFLHYIFLK